MISAIRSYRPQKVAFKQLQKNPSEDEIHLNGVGNPDGATLHVYPFDSFTSHSSLSAQSLPRRNADLLLAKYHRTL